MEKIKELQKVELKKDLPKYKLKKGQKGIIAFIDKKEIEVLLREKEVTRLVPVPVSFVNLIC